MDERNQTSPLAVSMGDPSGIGSDILLQVFHDKDKHYLPRFFVVGNLNFLRQRAKLLELDIAFEALGDDLVIPQNALGVVNIQGTVIGNPGVTAPQDGLITIAAIEGAVALVHENKASGVVTCPIQKEALYNCGFEYPGHTEFLAALAQEKWGNEFLPVMMIASDMLRTIPITIHVPLVDVPKRLTTELIIETAVVAHTDLQNRFGIENPRLAFAGLNPHAGENGTIGSEDGEIIAPAITALKDKGINAIGPLPADTMFHENARKNYDVALCMYHDQALIPAKTLAFDDGVNVTLGLPFVRTSPDHGTAYDIAGSGKANPSSFIAALKLAHKMSAKN